MTADSTSFSNHQVPGLPHREKKSCDHYCYPSSLKKCCSCEDLRPLSLSECGYDTYVDGQGWTTTAARDDGYCPVCNTKNYDKWMTRVRAVEEHKRQQDEQQQLAQKQQLEMEEHDRLVVKNKSHGRVEYSNGNVYHGDLLEGRPHGAGRMDYADNDDDILSYEGEWVEGKHQGKGKKVWMDHVWYQGNWYEGMMHGQGVYQLNEVDVMKGRFQEDVFQD
jgi:hypothetical protein